MTDISIIIRTLNEERYLPQLLEAIQQQETSFSYEIILIDSGSTDSTLIIAKKYGCQILHIGRDEFSFGRSLNRACEAAKGIYFAIISGHCIPCNKYWLERLVKPIKLKSVEYTYGRQVGGPETYWSESRIFDKYFPEESAVPQDGFYCNNANSAIRGATWSYYRFDEDLTGLEDMDLGKRLINNGGKIGYVSEASVYHLHNETWMQIRRRFEREALALQQICPEIILRRRDLVRYIIKAILCDLQSYPRESMSPIRIFEILRYRFSQYTGSYLGNHSHKKSSNHFRDCYFYPTNYKIKS